MSGIRYMLVLFVGVGALFTVAACSDKTENNAEETTAQAEQTAESAGDDAENEIEETQKDTP